MSNKRTKPEPKMFRQFLQSDQDQELTAGSRLIFLDKIFSPRIFAGQKLGNLITMNQIRFNCPGCGQKMEMSVEGQPPLVKCPTCQHEFTPENPHSAAATPAPPPPIQPIGSAANPSSPGAKRRGMAITSLVLGILSLLCFGLLAGIPAIILGHMAYGRARRMPTLYAGGGMGIAGFILGYVSIPISLLLIISFLMAGSLARSDLRETTIVDSENNLKGIGLAFRIWADDRDGQFPFNVSQAQGGTRELCNRDSNGIEQNPVPTFMVMSNELASPLCLVCPNDTSKHAVTDFANLTPNNISYELRTGPNVTEKNPAEILAIDPINGLILHCDGSVERNSHYKKSTK